MRTFEKLFEDLTKVHEINIVFNDFLDYSIDQFIINPGLKYFNYQKYSEEEYEMFYKLFSHWVGSSSEYLQTKPWFDMLGLIYEDIVQTKYKAGSRGQFFTPHDVCNALAQMSYVSNPLKDSEKVLTCYDSACGSGRTLLAWHVLRPQDILFGGDLDITSCKMTVLNFIIHGVKGSVNHMNSLSLEWFNGWKVNELIDYGHPFTIMEVNSERECEIFIGHNSLKKNVEIKNESPEVVKKEFPKTKQVTLI